MRLLVLGRGKTGSLVAEVAGERGHAVSVLGSAENHEACGLTRPVLENHDAVIDFTSPDAVYANAAACVTFGARVVIGTTGWYSQLPALAALATEHGGSLLHGTNFSIGVQAFFSAAQALAGWVPTYTFSIHEAHHVAKKDAPSGTAVTLQRIVAAVLPAGAEVPIESVREGDVRGVHVLEARSGNDLITLQHDTFSRRGFAEGAVRAAEWLVQQGPGVWDFSAVADKLVEPR